MKINAIETINLEEFPNLLWVHVHTDEGIVGLGETFYAVEPAIAHIHQTIAPYLLAQDPLQIDKHSRHMLYNYLGFKSVGAEMRAASAIDIALWDIPAPATSTYAPNQNREPPTSACPVTAANIGRTRTWSAL
jgi:L-alanine-DL-glutamate epimerase-like enolase superfamily enzyme